MVGRIRLHYGSGREFSLYPQHIVSCDRDPARDLTIIETVVGSTYECKETPDQIDALIQGAPPFFEAIPSQGGGEGRGPVYGDGSEMECRGAGGPMPSGSGWVAAGGSAGAWPAATTGREGRDV